MSPPDDFDRCRYEARVYRDNADAEPAATGYAVEFAGGAGANQTSWEENCETSAIGRALANLGYAKNRDERPSRQEMEKVERGPQRQAPRPNPPQTPPEPQQAPMAGADREIVSWTVFWQEAKKLGVPDMNAFTELTGRTIPEAPQHALNLLKKTIRERDAALATA